MVPRELLEMLVSKVLQAHLDWMDSLDLREREVNKDLKEKQENQVSQSEDQRVFEEMLASQALMELPVSMEKEETLEKLVRKI
jgi:predicted nucleotidyltransferase